MSGSDKPQAESWYMEAVEDEEKYFVNIVKDGKTEDIGVLKRGKWIASWMRRSTVYG